jgi:hypothetical protein
MGYDFSINSGQSFIKDLTVTTLRGLTGIVTNAMVSASAAIAASKLVNRVLAEYNVADGTNVAATGGDGVPVYTCTQAGGATLKSVNVVCPDAPSGGDLKFTVDVKKADAGAAAATMLTAVVDYSATQTDYEQEVAAITTSTIDFGDTLLVVVAVSGSTGTQGQGLIVQLEIEEAGA